mmetsp:Transcript_5166/g.15687  ORF Transcript_5166/g.15687 Transcript_5166/m.15687 type:complete len:236 (+) Transcript_5166:1313-2020(+)
MLLRTKPKHKAKRSDPSASITHGRVRKPTAGRGRPRAKPRPAVTLPSLGNMRAPAEDTPEDLLQVLPALAAPHQDIDQMLRDIKQGYASDPWFKSADNTADLQYREGVWFSCGRMPVPATKNIRHAILHELHDPPYSGHPGTHKLLRSVQRSFWWPGIAKDVKEFVKNCPTCQRNKSSTQKPAGELHPLHIPEAPWASVSMDFMTQLPSTVPRHGATKGYDAIVVFVDRLPPFQK